MEFNFLEKNLEKNINEDSSNRNVSGFIEELGKFIQNLAKSSSSKNLEDDKIFVVRDINDEKLSLVDIQNGKEFDVYVSNSKNNIENFNNIYEISKDDLYSLDLGKGVTVKSNRLVPYNGELKIENAEALAKLEDMYFSLEQEKHSIYSVAEISEKKIYLTDVNEGGYFSIPREKYPDFQLGDLVTNENGIYILKDSLS